MPDLLDASVWLPWSAPNHMHYPRARRYWDDEAASELAFCRVTALALLRHLTNPRILGDAALDGGAAWRALKIWLALPQIKLLGEPAGLGEGLGQRARELDPRAGKWGDAYPSAFAAAGRCRLGAFCDGLSRYPGGGVFHPRGW